MAICRSQYLLGYQIFVEMEQGQRYHGRVLTCEHDKLFHLLLVQNPSRLYVHPLQIAWKDILLPTFKQCSENIRSRTISIQTIFA